MEKRLKQENMESSAMSEDEKAKVVKHHQQQIASLDREMAAEKARQQEIMKEKMAERRMRVRQQEEKIKEDAAKAEQKLREELQSKVHAAEAEQLAQIAASEMDKEKVVKAAQVMLRERHRREMLEMNARHMADVAQATSSALQQLEISYSQRIKDAEANHQRAIEGLSGEELDKAKLAHKAALDRLNEKFKLEQTSVEGRALQDVADKHKQEVAMFERRREAELRQGANGEIIDMDPLNSASDDIAAQVLEQTRIVNEDKKLALEKLYAEKEKFMADERLKAIAEEEAFLAGLQEEKKKAIAALTAQQQRELDAQKKQLMEIQSVEERELIIKRHQAKAQSIEDDLKAERSKQDRAAAERFEKMKQRKAELRKNKVIADMSTESEKSQALVLEKRLVRQQTLRLDTEVKQREAIQKVIFLWQQTNPQIRAEHVKLKAVRRFKELLDQRICRLGSIESRRVHRSPASSSLSCEPEDIRRVLVQLTGAGLQPSQSSSAQLSGSMAIQVEEAFLAGLQEEKKKTLAALVAQQESQFSFVQSFKVCSQEILLAICFFKLFPQGILDQFQTSVKCEESDIISEAACRSDKITRIKADIARVEEVISKTEAALEQVRYRQHLLASCCS
jgi:aspartate beta-hydroxylase